MPAVHDRVAPAEGPAARAAHALAAVEAAGGRVIAGVSVQRFVVREGRVATILLARRRRIRVEGEVLVAHPPAEVAGWLGEAIPDPIHAHAGRLSFRHALEVLLPADDADLPDEIHLVGPGGPFFRITLPGRCPGHTDLAGHVLLHATIDPDDPLWRAPDADIEDAARAALAEFPGIPIRCGDAHIRRLEEDQPCWTLGSAPSWLRVRAAFASLGVVGVGRSGTFGHLDPLGEVRFLEALLADVPLREAHRLHVDPPFDAPRRPGELPGFVYR